MSFQRAAVVLDLPVVRGIGRIAGVAGLLKQPVVGVVGVADEGGDLAGVGVDHVILHPVAGQVVRVGDGELLVERRRVARVGLMRQPPGPVVVPVDRGRLPRVVLEVDVLRRLGPRLHGPRIPVSSLPSMPFSQRPPTNGHPDIHQRRKR